MFFFCFFFDSNQIKSKKKMTQRAQHLIRVFEKEQVFPYTSIQQDETKWNELLEKGQQEVKKYLEKRDEELKTDIAVEDLSLSKKKERKREIQNLKTYESVAPTILSSEQFTQWFKSLYTILQKLDPGEARQFVTVIQDEIILFLDNLERAQAAVATQNIEVESKIVSKVITFEQFVDKLAKTMKKEIERMYERFSSALQRSKKHVTNLERAQHEAAQDSIRTQFTEETNKLKKSIDQEKKSFSVFLQRVKTLLDKFPTKGTLTCPGNLFQEAGRGKEETTTISLRAGENDSSFFNLSFPKKRQVQFAKDLRDIIVSVAPQYQLSSAPREETITASRCPRKSAGKFLYTPSPHQALMGKLFHPRLKMYKGFLAFHDVGTGKTFVGIEAIYTWFLYAFPSEYSYVTRDVLILVSTRPIATEWQTRLLQVFQQRNIKIATKHSLKDNTRILEIGEGTSSLFVIIQSFPTAKLDGNSFKLAKERNWTTITRADQQDFNKKNNARSQPFSEIYKNEKVTKPFQLSSDISSYLYPPKGLVIVDEAHLAINPTDVAGDVRNQRNTLHWTIGLKYMPGIKLLLATGTPIADSNRPLDAIKLLNLLKFPNEPNILPEGIWREPLGSGDSKKKPEQELNRKTNKLEKEILSQYLQNDQIYGTYAGLVSFLTLQYDLSVYPKVINQCPILPGNNSCQEFLSSLGSQAQEQKSNIPCMFSFDGTTFSCGENKQYIAANAEKEEKEIKKSIEKEKLYFIPIQVNKIKTGAGGGGKKKFQRKKERLLWQMLSNVGMW